MTLGLHESGCKFPLPFPFSCFSCHGDGLDAVVVDHVSVPVELRVGIEGALRALVYLRYIVGHFKKSLYREVHSFEDLG